MSNLPLRDLKWTQKNLNPLAELELTAYSALHEYVITEPKQGKFELKKTRLSRPDKKSEFLPYFDTVTEAQDWAWAHYQRSMQPYVIPDSITDIKSWFQAAKPEPTKKDVCTQVGCHYEEVAEMMEAMQGHDHRASQMMSSIADTYKMRHLSVDGIVESVLIDSMQPKDHIELLDALCDQIVTATGVAYMMGFDIEGALKEVIRSNNSKMVKGKFEYDENGKIAKPESYSEPDLKPFISTMQNLHKGD